MNAVVIGCGLIGKKRAENLGSAGLVAACDTDFKRAEALAAAHPGCRPLADWREAAAFPAADIVVVSTTHDQLATVALAALGAGKHVLVEKPGARSRREFEPVATLAQKMGKTLKIGFNHRFHPSILKAQQIISEGQAGPMMFLRGRYGHGGRLSYEKEWRASREISGGGELIDQGMHLIDLARLFLGDFSEVQGYTPTYFWDMQVEDNAFIQLKTPSGQAAWLHASWTEWKNMFSLEIYARHAKIQIDGLGGSYGPERLTHYQMLPELGPPKTEVHEFPGPDLSWALEFEDFLAAIKNGKSPGGSAADALAALEIVDSIYLKQGKA